MNTNLVLVPLCAVIALSACSASTASTDNAQLLSTLAASEELNKAQMKIYITSAESQLLKLEQLESKRCLSGQLTIAQSYLTRATAEHNADMEKDAFITLVDFDRQIRKNSLYKSIHKWSIRLWLL